MNLASKVVALFALAGSMPGALAGFSPNSNGNIAIYWGQNSVNLAGAQQRLGAYCQDTNVNTIPVAFLMNLSNPVLNFANAGDNCTTFPGTELYRCPQLEEDIKTCQSLGKSILLSIGGATYAEGGPSSVDEAITAADRVWAMFGPVSSSSGNRPFGTAVIDGFDFDFESSVHNMLPFATRLRSLMDSATATTGRKYLLSSAPQCPFPDVANDELLRNVAFDFVSVQFYNNYCGVHTFQIGATSQNFFNFDTWDNWAKTVSKNKDVKILVGVPGSPTAAGIGYVAGGQLANVIKYSQTFSSFGGVMMWDMSQVYRNTGFLDSVVTALGVTGGNNGGSAPIDSTTAASTSTTTDATTSVPVPTTTPSATVVHTATNWVTVTIWTTATVNNCSGAPYEGTSTKSSSTQSTTAPSTPTQPAGVVNQWGQCGGIGYTGPTSCRAPYTCVKLGDWWSHCN
ncbi:glycoside hydrolase superfamily [Sordaria brevicollis]|uniref:chitinase n=1 Tax=Sordaria brevicollis TaxID=83679 RepID=A0AAE0UEB4_SORBR|nr:glycoside hydrolase superfamily [Sordaria brevicollis]